jgi:hypothetical protein
MSPARRSSMNTTISKKAEPAEVADDYRPWIHEHRFDVEMRKRMANK